MESRLDEILEAQQAHTQAINNLSLTVQMTNTLLRQIIDWLQKPAGSSDLRDIVIAILNQTQQNQLHIMQVPAKTVHLINNGPVEINRG